jgi:uncharacterized membrane protein YgcG
MIASSTMSVRSRRRSARGLLSIAIGHWLAGPGCSLAAEVISSFDSDVRLAKDGELTITETVRVQAEERDIRHGIYRDFPLTFKDAGGVIREVDFSPISVERDGRPEEYSTTASAASSASIPAAKARSFQAASTRTSSRYRTGRQVRWFDGKPELNWNLTGNFWRFPIMTASYHLQFVAGGEPPRWTAYTGRLGERGRDWRGSLGALGTLSVETTRRLAPGEGLTVVAEIPLDAIDVAVRAHPGDSDPMSSYQPRWSTGGPAAISAVSAEPASSGSSGFSGGGGSGGGGGGGGAGGW